MNPSAQPAADPDPVSPLVGTLPLIGLTAALLGGAYLIHLGFPRLGPSNFPLWGLLLTLGFVAAFGAVVSFFFATDETESSVPSAEAESPKGRTSRSDFGRPIPDLTPKTPPSPLTSGTGLAAAAGGAPPAPWDEDVLPPVPARGPRPVLTTPDDPGDIGRALEEIADIQRELSARRASALATGEAPARA
ncbi:MAG: hypothetical protein WA691_07165 [Thermoplasmata archaeon]